MSVYRIEDERAIRVQRLVADWTKSGLLSDAQREQILPELKVDLRRTNLFLRATLFVFGFIIVMAVSGLTALFVDLRDGFWVLAGVLGAAAWYAAVQLVKRYRFYRFGVEEACIVASVVFLAVAAGGLVDATGASFDFAMSAGLAAAAAATFVAFHHFGFVYTAIVSMLCLAALPLQIIDADMPRRILAVAILLTVFLAVRRSRVSYGREYPGDSYAIIEAVAWAAAYVLVNLQLSPWIAQPDDISGTFYWLTYGAVWLWPAIGLWLAIRDRHRWMLDANVLLALATLMTNKSYLGGVQHSYDPIVFGVMLIVIAIGLRRWLAAGPDGARAGFTPLRVLASEQERLSMAGTVSVLAPGAPQAAQPEPDPGIGGGGRAGGAGASGNWQ